MILSYPPNYYNNIEMVDTAVCSESETMREEYTRMIKHYFLPISTQQANLETRFLTLKTQWEAETAILSSVTEIALHPAYQQIIGMGHTAIRLILLEMKKRPGHWFWALKSITGEDPILLEQRGRMKEMTQAWLRWGREKNYL